MEQPAFVHAGKGWCLPSFEWAPFFSVHLTFPPLLSPFSPPLGGEHGKFATMISYGTFDFDFGVALMEYIMNK